MNQRTMRKFGRRGTSVVEMAVMAPLLLTAMFGMFEVGYAFMCKQTVTLAAREGARAASLPGGNMEDVNSAVNACMGSAKLSGYSTSSNISQLGPTDYEVWVAVDMPFDRASFTGNLLGGGTFNISAKATMRREGLGEDAGNQGIEPP